ncbi:hypothetical protein [uncultured Sphingomonas sp.]|uniref:hypothetical protein n=1 Tax=uncultured Sphingomonas sp. TaxID=158754 RepID=UPI0035CA37A1
MTLYRTAALAIAIAIAGIAAAIPANAAAGHGIAGLRLTTASQVAPCSTPESKQCATYQRALLQIVQDKELNGNSRATMEKVGRQQLDALIASVD